MVHDLPDEGKAVDEFDEVVAKLKGCTWAELEGVARAADLSAVTVWKFAAGRATNPKLETVRALRQAVAKVESERLPA